VTAQHIWSYYPPLEAQTLTPTIVRITNTDWNSHNVSGRLAHDSNGNSSCHDEKEEMQKLHTVSMAPTRGSAGKGSAKNCSKKQRQRL
jgi:hypothetical protein